MKARHIKQRAVLHTELRLAWDRKLACDRLLERVLALMGVRA